MIRQKNIEVGSMVGLLPLEYGAASLTTPGANEAAVGIWVPKLQRAELVRFSIEGTFTGGTTPAGTVTIGTLDTFARRADIADKTGLTSKWVSSTDGGVTFDSSVNEPNFADMKDGGFLIADENDIVAETAGSGYPGIGIRAVLDITGSPSSMAYVSFRCWLRLFFASDI